MNMYNKLITTSIFRMSSITVRTCLALESVMKQDAAQRGSIRHIL